MGKFIRMGLAAASLFFTVYSFIQGWSIIGTLMIFVSLFVTLSIFRNENILAALYYIRKSNLEKAAKSLDKIKRPENLFKNQEAYYYYLKGMVASQTQSISISEKMMRKALSIGLRSEQDQALAKLHLASIAISRRRKREATNLLAEVKKLDKKGILGEQISIVKQQMKRI